MRKLLCLLVLLLPLPALADVANGLPQFNWTAPTQWTDGTTMTAAQLTGYRISCSPGGYVMRVAGNLTTFTVAPSDRFAAGAYSCVLYAFGKYTTTTAETMGAATAPVTFTVPQPTPGVPGAFSVN